MYAYLLAQFKGQLLSSYDANGLHMSSTESLLDLNKPPDAEGILEEAELYEDDSPYEEVRAAVSNTDDASMPCVITFYKRSG